MVMRSRFSAGRVVGFYAPVRFEGEICGVLVGFLNEHTVSNLLRTQLYGYAADTMLLDGNGTVLGRYIDSQTEKIANVRDVTHTIREDQRTKAMEALENRTSCAFRFQGTAGERAPDASFPWRGRTGWCCSFFRRRPCGIWWTW